MRWKTISATSYNGIYQLSQGDQKLLTLTLHPFSHTLRLENEDKKRVFQIREEGFIRHKTVLRNEYGIKVGQLGIENQDHFIEVNNERFYYTIHKGPIAEIRIYKEHNTEPYLVCGLDIQINQPTIALDKGKAADFLYTSLLMALCWHLFQPVAQAKEEEFAALG